MPVALMAAISARLCPMQCSLAACCNKSQARGWCGKHYTRWLRHGSPEGTAQPLRDLSPAERWRALATAGETLNACWGWRGSIQSGGGYALVSSRHYAHRIAYEATHGDIPDGMYVLHSCDNPPCSNPIHLFVGTNLDNMEDMSRKGRARNGNERKTHCPQGHEYTPANTYRRRDRPSRHCRACAREQQRAFEQRKTAATQ